MFKFNKRTVSKLSEESVRTIRDRVAKGDSRAQIGQDFGITKQSVDRIYWRHTHAWVADSPEEQARLAADMTEAEKKRIEEEFMDPAFLEKLDKIAEQAAEYKRFQEEQMPSTSRERARGYGARK
jgi:hypothetical protein